MRRGRNTIRDTRANDCFFNFAVVPALLLDDLLGCIYWTFKNELNLFCVHGAVRRGDKVFEVKFPLTNI